jgi:16S rRNA (guanine527-N7)-methyltransferase
VKPIPPFLLSYVGPSLSAALERFEEMLTSRAVPLGFIAPGDSGSMWDRHVVDSLRGAVCLASDALAIADIGSGAGLPGIPLALARPDCRFTLIEPRARRAAFLELVVAELGLSNARVSATSADRVEPTGFDACLARAVADPARSWAMASRLLAPDGVLIYWAGRSWKEPVGGVKGVSVRYEVCCPPSTETSGPLVKMARGAPSHGSS